MPILLCLIWLQLSSLWGLPCPTSTRKRGLGNQLTAPFSSPREHSLPLCEASDVWGRRPRHLVIKRETWDILVNSIRGSVMTDESSNGEMLWSTTNCLRWFPLWYLEIVLDSGLIILVAKQDILWWNQNLESNFILHSKFRCNWRSSKQESKSYFPLKPNYNQSRQLGHKTRLRTAPKSLCLLVTLLIHHCLQNKNQPIRKQVIVL